MPSTNQLVDATLNSNPDERTILLPTTLTTVKKDLKKGLTVEEESNQRQCSCRSCFSKTLLPTQFIGKTVTGFAQAEYTGATLITDIFSFKRRLLGLSTEGIVAAAVPAVFFAAAEGYSHFTQSALFDHHVDENRVNQTVKATTPLAKLTYKQMLWASLHYFSDVYEGMAIWLLLAKLAGLEEWSLVSRACFYTGLTIWSGWINGKEWENTTIAFREENERKGAVNAFKV